MKAFIGLTQRREFFFAAPIKGSTVHYYTANHHTVAAEKLSCRMHNNICTQINGSAQIRASNGAIDHQWDTMAMRYIGKNFKVDYIACWITYGFTENRFGILIN